MNAQRLEGGSAQLSRTHWHRQRKHSGSPASSPAVCSGVSPAHAGGGEDAAATAAETTESASVGALTAFGLALPHSRRKRSG
jgi:hypothetical protein